MAIFIARVDEPGVGPRVAVKDLIDMVGLPTTAGCRAVAERAQPAVSDASCLRGIRLAGFPIVGKTNLHELAMSATGINPWFGTPPNPLDYALIPGGSSSGSASAVGHDQADIALGTDTGGSVRIPSACCGTAGLKTTFGRIPVDGVWPLAASLDTVGPMARDLSGLVLGMQLLEPGFARAPEAAKRIGRLPTQGLPEIEEAVDEALALAEFDVVDVEIPEWEELLQLFTVLFRCEAWEADHRLLEEHPEGLGEDSRTLLELGASSVAALGRARAQLATLRKKRLPVFDKVELVALPTLPIFPPCVADVVAGDQTVNNLVRHTFFANVTGIPALAFPIPVRNGQLPASLQMIGPAGGEELLLTTGAIVEAAVR